MRQNRIEAYEQGYLDGLREAHAELLDGASVLIPAQEERGRAEVHWHPVYCEGFSEGLRDGTEVLLAIGKTSRLKQL
jgi:hypothetical protein